MVSDLRSCTMLSTLPLFYIAQSVNSDDRRTRIQGLRVIMLCKTCLLSVWIFLNFSLYTDVVLFFFSASALGRARRARKKNKELFSSSPTPTALRWRSINLPRVLFFITRSTDLEEKMEGLRTD